MAAGGLPSVVIRLLLVALVACELHLHGLPEDLHRPRGAPSGFKGLDCLSRARRRFVTYEREAWRLQ